MSSKRNAIVAVCLALLIGPSTARCQLDVSDGNPSVNSLGRDASRVVQPASHQTFEQDHRFSAPTETRRMPNVPRAGSSLVRTVTSLGVVAGLMLGFIWWTRKQASDGLVGLPGNLVEVVGRVSLDAKHKAHVVRFGDRILLLSLDGAGVSKLGEISAAEFDRRETNASSRDQEHRSPALHRRGAFR